MWFFKNFCSFLQQLSFFVYIAWVFCQIIQKIFILNWTTWWHWYLLEGNSIFEQYSVWRIFWDENFLCCWLKKKVRAFRGIKYCLFQYEKPRDTQNMGKKSRYFSEIWTPKSITSLPILYDSGYPLLVLLFLSIFFYRFWTNWHSHFETEQNKTVFFWEQQRI